MTLAQIRARVLYSLDDAGGVYWTPAEVDHSINVAQRLWCLLTLCLEKTTSFTLVTDQAFYRVSDQIDDFIVSLRVSFSGTRLKSDTIHNLDLRSTTWRQTPGDPTRYAQHGFNLLAVTPQPASGTPSLDMVYAAEPAVMVLDADVPEIEPEQQIWLERFAFWFCCLKNGGIELKNAGKFLNEFLDAAAKYASFTRARSRAQMYDNVPFDLASYDRSRWEIKIRNQAQPKRENKQ